MPWIRCARLDLLLARCLGGRRRAVVTPSEMGMTIPLPQSQEEQE